jgi:hypothetical protein
MSTEYKIKLELNLTIIPTTGETLQSLAVTTDQPLRRRPIGGEDPAGSLAETNTEPSPEGPAGPGSTDHPDEPGGPTRPHKRKLGEDPVGSLAETTDQPLTGTHKPKRGEGPFKSLAETTDQP